MKKLSQRNEVESWSPTAREAQTLSDQLAKYEPREVNGRKQYPFELFLADKEIISFGEFGEIQVRNPVMYSRQNDTYDLMKWIAEKEQEKLFQAFPEERAAWRTRIQKLMAEVRESVFKTGDKLKT